MTVQRNRRQIFQLGQIVFLGDVLVLFGFQLIDNVSGRVNVNFVVNRIQNQIVVVLHLLGHVAGAYNCRQFQGASHDGGVGSPAAEIGNEAQHFVQVQLCGLRRGQIGSDQDNFVLDGAQIDDSQAQNVLQQAFTDVAYVGRTLFQVFIVKFFQCFRLAFDDGVGRSVCRSQLIFD
ncbi:hypothetical protein D3C72_1767850 [compost metagenome]